jgi:CheY-like chemotaxis protein
MVSSESTTNQKIKMLLVDDSDEFRELVIAYLKAFPFEIEEAADGTQALHKMKELEFDVVLMDYKMPIMDGATTTKLFREWEERVGRKHLQIIALSAFSRKQDLEDFFSAGCDEYLTKPIRRMDLVSALTGVLQKYEL